MSKATIWTGRVLTALTGLMLLFAGINALFLQTPEMKVGFEKFGYPPQSLVPIGIAAFLGGLLYLIPRTSMLGAILLTAYLGGATATHVRASDGLFPIPITVGCLIWLGLYLREERIRALVPLRK
ncbi:MAG: DoxX family protein [Acidobacteria bacterium]|nr:DoxX family protein [Acidobacteriota bacterium]